MYVWITEAVESEDDFEYLFYFLLHTKNLQFSFWLQFKLIFTGISTRDSIVIPDFDATRAGTWTTN